MLYGSSIPTPFYCSCIADKRKAHACVRACVQACMRACMRRAIVSGVGWGALFFSLQTWNPGALRLALPLLVPVTPHGHCRAAPRRAHTHTPITHLPYTVVAPLWAVCRRRAGRFLRSYAVRLWERKELACMLASMCTAAGAAVSLRLNPSRPERTQGFVHFIRWFVGSAPAVSLSTTLAASWHDHVHVRGGS